MKDIQNLINNNLNSLCRDFPRPAQKAIKETFNGILRGKTCVFQKIFSETTNRRVSKKAERAIHQLKQTNISLAVNKFLTQRVSSTLEKDEVIAFDEGDIAKPEARKMEGISRIWDASKKKRCNGYRLCGMAGRASFSQLELWDTNKESISQIRWRMVQSIPKENAQKAIFTFDRGHDHTRLIQQFIENDLRFIIRAKDLRKPFDNKLQKKRKITDYAIGYHSITVTTKTSHKKAIAPEWTGQLYLVVTNRKNTKGSIKKAYFLTNLSPTAYSCKQIMYFYDQRWNIERHYQQIKHHYGLESVRTQSFSVLQSLLALCQFAIWISAEIHKKLRKKSKLLGGFLYLFISFKQFCKRFCLHYSSVSAFRSFLSSNLAVFFAKTHANHSPPRLFSLSLFNFGVF